MKKFDKRETIFHLCYLLHLVVCDDDIYICKIKKNKVPWHAVADKLLAKWSPKELWQSDTEKLGD